MRTVIPDVLLLRPGVLWWLLGRILVILHLGSVCVTIARAMSGLFVLGHKVWCVCLSVCLVNARAHRGGLPTYRRATTQGGPLHVPATQQSAATPTHSTGIAIGSERAGVKAICLPRTSLALEYVARP